MSYRCLVIDASRFSSCKLKGVIKMTDFYRKSSEEVMKTLGVTDKGLSQDEVQQKREEYGFNELEEGKRKSTMQSFS